jgi:hypothetical protein
MIVRGIDFTSRPASGKRLVCVEATLASGVLAVAGLSKWPSFEGFEQALQLPGPWIAGIDFPFGQARRFIETIGWPTPWPAYVAHAAGLGRQGFRASLDAYRASRATGDKEHRRMTDKAAAAISPQKLYGVPVGLMFYEGAQRLVSAGVTVPGLQAGDPERIVVEAYPGCLARHLIGRRPYKTDDRQRQTPEQHRARRDMLEAILGGALESRYGFRVDAKTELADDPSGDSLDALLCAVQAAWAWTMREAAYGMPIDCDRLEGWIADPLLTVASGVPTRARQRAVEGAVEGA